MAFSLKKGTRSKGHMTSGVDDDSNALGEVLHRSGNTSKSKKNKKKGKIYDSAPSDNHHNGDSDLDVPIRIPDRDRSKIYRSTCPCESHYEKLLFDHGYELNVDKLFDLIFGSNEFVRTFRETQRIYDETASDWSTVEEKKYRQRVLNYKVPYESALIGKGIVVTREKQTLLHEVPGSHYVVETEVSNSGVKFSDTFIFSIRYCLVQKSISTTHVRITGHVQFIKSVYSLVKQIIESNAYSASQESLKDLHNRLNLISNFKIEKSRLSRVEAAIKLSPANNDRLRRLSRYDYSNVTDSSRRVSATQHKCDDVSSIVSKQPDKAMLIVVFAVAFLLMIHLYLYIKLTHMDILVDNLSQLMRMTTSIVSQQRS